MDKRRYEWVRLKNIRTVINIDNLNTYLEYLLTKRFILRSRRSNIPFIYIFGRHYSIGYNLTRLKYCILHDTKYYIIPVYFRTKVMMYKVSLGLKVDKTTFEIASVIYLSLESYPV